MFEVANVQRKNISNGYFVVNHSETINVLQRLAVNRETLQDNATLMHRSLVCECDM